MNGLRHDKLGFLMIGITVKLNSAYKFLFITQIVRIFEKIMNGHDNLKFEWHNRNLNSEDVNKYVHNLMKEKLDRVSERLLD